MTLEEAARRGVEAAAEASATDAEAWAEEATSRRVRVYDGEVESLSDAGGRGVGVRAFVDGRSGYAYGTDLSEQGVREVARAARAAAEAADPDEHGGLP
ncbi:MAG: PmbA/TldA family metallopeptidase, partial [Thermoleophilaceae bacterium]